ncbi:MAG: glycosyltransferase [Candidatus Shapirobacteria bacterium]|jgi:glycosyltransferase involved in cell wall biosynthesis
MTKTIDFIIPVYNESMRLSSTVSALNSFAAPKDLKVTKVIFINDGSTDKTLALLKSAKIKFPKKIVSYPKNMGKGFAIKQGFLAATSDYALFFDADMSTPLSEIKKFIPFISANTSVILGTRKNGHSTVIKHQPWLRENLGKCFTLLSRIILNTNVTDFTCGFKAFSKPAYQTIGRLMTIPRWGFDSEIIFLASRLNFSIAEKSVIWADEPNTKVHLLKDIFRSLSELLQIRVNYFKGVYQLKAKNYKSPGLCCCLASFN